MKTAKQLQEETLSVLADGGFADKRTEIEAWRDALAAAKRLRAITDAAHTQLKALGHTRGVLDLVS